MNLTGQQIKNTYEGVLNIGATGLTGTLQEITDGLGNNLGIQVSETTINFSSTVTGLPVVDTSPITVQQTCSLVSTAIGATAGAGANCAVVIGNAATAPGASLGGIAIGSAAAVSCGFSPAQGQIAIGQGARTNRIDGIAIGRNASGAELGVALGVNANAQFASVSIGSSSLTGFGAQIAIGSSAQSGGQRSISVGESTTSPGDNSIAIGRLAKSCSADSIALGCCSLVPTTAACAIVVGKGTRVFPGATGSVVIGANSIGATGLQNAVVLGPNLTSIKANTIHVDSLIAYGQAASLTHAIGSTGGTVGVDFNNSNIQTLTLTDNAILDKSNPIDGGVYTLFITQGGVGGYSVFFGADVKFAGGTGPTLSTEAGKTDAVSLVFIAGVTGYFGNANLNFA